jgi:hypothetical protein
MRHAGPACKTLKVSAGGKTPTVIQQKLQACTVTYVAPAWTFTARLTDTI